MSSRAWRWQEAAILPRGREIDTVTKAYKSSILGIEEHTFNKGQNKFAAQFTQSRVSVANILH